MLKPIIFFLIAAALLVFFLNKTAQNGQAQQVSPFAFTGRGIGAGLAVPPGGGASSASSQTNTSAIRSPGQSSLSAPAASPETNAPSAITPTPGTSAVTSVLPKGDKPPVPVTPIPSPGMTPALSVGLSTAPSAPAGSISPYQDGVYTGDLLVTPEGSLQVQTTIRGGRIADLQFLSFPRSGLANFLGSYLVAPLLRQEVVAAQGTAVAVPLVSAPVKDAFLASFQSSLDKALSPR